MLQCSCCPFTSSRKWNTQVKNESIKINPGPACIMSDPLPWEVAYQYNNSSGSKETDSIETDSVDSDRDSVIIDAEDTEDEDDKQHDLNYLLIRFMILSSIVKNCVILIEKYWNIIRALIQKNRK